MKWLDERNIGYPVGAAASSRSCRPRSCSTSASAATPKIRPGADCGYKAADAASEAPVQEGNVGAGAGATVGKIRRPRRGRRPDEGGDRVGRDQAAERSRRRRDRRGQRRRRHHRSVDRPGRRRRARPGRQARSTRARCCAAAAAREGRAGENTTIGLVATNAKLTKVQAQKMAQMAHDGFARAISPVAHAGRRRHDLLAGDRHVGRHGELRPDRRAGRRSDGRRDRPRGDAGDRVERPAAAHAIWERCRRGSRSSAVRRQASSAV